MTEGREALKQHWRGNYMLQSAINKIIVHMQALDDRFKGPKYDVFGPWPVNPKDSVY